MIPQNPDSARSTGGEVAYYGLPREVRFCARCGMSNQRPKSAIEFKNADVKEVVDFDANGLCGGCRFHDLKDNVIDWEDRHGQLLALLDRHRSKDGSYDVIVPGSGGKDSTYVSHVLKYKYGMHPLTVTWPPHMYTDIGWTNFIAWLDSGMDNVSYHPNRRVHRRLTREAFLNLLHPFQPFIVGQKQVGPKTALKYGVKLVMYGESNGENGSHFEEALQPTMRTRYFAVPQGHQTDVRLAGLTYAQLIEKGFEAADFLPYLPVTVEDVEAAGIEVHYMGFYEKWRPQDKFYYAVEHCGFTPNPERTEGTFSKYASLDDKIDGFHYYTTFIKFGIGRATYDASQEVRNHHLSREEAVSLIRRYDGAFPKRYFREFLDYIELDEDTFWQRIDAARSPHLWKKEGNEWLLRHQVT